MSYDSDLLDSAKQLLKRKSGQRGKLPSARIRRSISTSYYALFHFLIADATQSVVGAGNNYRIRRRVLARSFSHGGMKKALDKVKGKSVSSDVASFFSGQENAGVDTPTPIFGQTMAKAFISMQAKRHEADYDLNIVFSIRDAYWAILLAVRAITQWRRATTPTDKDIKKALFLLMVLKGQLRTEG